VSGKITAGKSALSKTNLRSLDTWVHAGFPKHSSAFDGFAGEMESNVQTAMVTAGASDLEYQVSFNCISTINHLDFEFEGRMAWVEHTKTALPFAKITFSNFLDDKVKPAVIAVDAQLTSTAQLWRPSVITKALEDAGFGNLADCFKKPDDFADSVKTHTSGAISQNAIKPLEDRYDKATRAFAAKAGRRAWKMPALLSIGGWWVACHYDIPQGAANMESPLWMAGLALATGLTALLVSNFEARYAIVSEANTIRGWKAGPTAYACAFATATLFWTSSYYGFKI
jgi:hypothetical protein